MHSHNCKSSNRGRGNVPRSPTDCSECNIQLLNACSAINDAALPGVCFSDVQGTRSNVPALPSAQDCLAVTNVTLSVYVTSSTLPMSKILACKAAKVLASPSPPELSYTLRVTVSTPLLPAAIARTVPVLPGSAVTLVAMLSAPCCPLVSMFSLPRT